MAKVEAGDGRLVVERILTVDPKSKIIMPETVEGYTALYKVLHVGRGRLLESGAREEMSVKAGDRIVIDLIHDGDATFIPTTTVQLGKEKVEIVRWNDVAAVVR